MKFSLPALIAACLSPAAVVKAAGEDECTHGRLFVSSADTSEVRVFDLDSQGKPSLVTSVPVPLADQPEIRLNTDSKKDVVAAIYRGQQSNLFRDGSVSWIHAGISAHSMDGRMHVDKVAPSMLTEANFECACPIHFVQHDEKIAIFCDGAVTETDLESSTIWVLDEDRLTSGDSAIIYSQTLEGSHHGIVIPVDDEHVLHSLTLPERKAKTDITRATFLPSTFQVVNYQDEILHAINGTSSPDTSCPEFHGNWGVDNTFALACDDANHDGVLMIDYDPTTGQYTSRGVGYPSEYPDHRTRFFAEHHKCPKIVGDFRGETQYYLMAFDPEDNAIPNEGVLPVGNALQCGYLFEESEGQLMMVLTPDGVFSVYEVDPEWKLLASTTVIPTLATCEGVHLVSGYAQAFVLFADEKKVYSINLSNVQEDKLEVSEMDLGFTPFFGIVSGVPAEAACTLSDNDNGGSSGSSGSTILISLSFVVTLLGAAFVK